YQAAAARLLESLALFRQLGDQRGMAECLAGMAGVAGATGQPERAARLFWAAAALLTTIGAVLLGAHLADHGTNAGAVRAGRDRATGGGAWAHGAAVSLAEAIAEAQQVATEVTKDRPDA